MIDVFKEAGEFNWFQEFFETKRYEQVHLDRGNLFYIKGLIDIYQEYGADQEEVIELIQLITPINCIEDFDYLEKDNSAIITLHFVSGTKYKFTIEVNK